MLFGMPVGPPRRGPYAHLTGASAPGVIAVESKLPYPSARLPRVAYVLLAATVCSHPEAPMRRAPTFGLTDSAPLRPA